MPPALQTLHVTAQDAGKTLQEILRTRLDLPNRQAKALIDSRNVFVNGKRVWMARHPLRTKDVITLPAGGSPAGPPPGADIPVLHRDPWILAVNKPPGLISESARGSLEDRLRAQENQPGLRALHRLDKDTSGVILFAREGTDRGPYIDLFRDKAVQKEYLALVRGVPEQNHFIIQNRLDNKEALTEVWVLARTRTHAVLRCRIPTGRTHQIRRHLLIRQLVIVGERAYGQGEQVVHPLERSLTRQMLHAWHLSLPCPHTARTVSIQAPLLSDMSGALNTLHLSEFRPSGGPPNRR